MDEPGEFFDDTALEIAAALLDAGASVDAKNREGERPLHVATRDGHRGLALLLERGADVDARTSRGWTPLHCAVDYENEAGVAQLLAAGADRKVTDVDGHTPLDLARLASSRSTSADLLRIIGLLET